MKVLVPTSDNYSYLIEPHYTLFNKYWPDQEIVYLGFDDKNVPDLPDNCSFHSLGKQSDFGRNWTNPLIPYINNIKDEHFVFSVEDMMLTDYVDLDRMQLLENEIVNGNAQKAILDIHLNRFATEYKGEILQLKRTAPYRTTLHPCIWKKEYFQRYLKPNFTAWEFEVHRINTTESYFDNARIISLKGVNGPDDRQSNLFKSANVFRKGVPFPRWQDKGSPWGCDTDIDVEDIVFIMKFVLNNRKEQQTLNVGHGN